MTLRSVEPLDMRRSKKIEQLMALKRKLRSYYTRVEQPVCPVLGDGKEPTLYGDATQEEVNQA